MAAQLPAEWRVGAVLNAVVESSAPVASVYLGPGPDTLHEYDLRWGNRWRTVAAGLRRTGVDERTHDLLENAVREVSSARSAHEMCEIAAYAQDGRVLAVIPAPGAGWPDDGRVTPLPRLLPLLEWLQALPPYVDVVIDRTGAEIDACPGGGRPATRTSVAGPDDEIERNAPGGFLAQGRYQRRAEDSWRHNAGAVAEHVVAALEGTRAQLLVVSGDVRAVQYLRAQLPEGVRKTVHVEEIAGGRAPDGSQQHRAERVAAVVAATVAAETRALHERFTEQRSPHGLAVEGEDATFEALAQGRVDILLVAHPLVDDPRASWFGQSATEVRPGTRPTPSWPEPRRAAMVDVAVRSALMAGGSVRVMPAGAPMAEGVGALCRYHPT